MLLECTADLERCIGELGFAGGDDNGEFDVEVMVRAAFTDAEGTVDCRVEACVLASGIGIESGRPEALEDRTVPLSFDPAAPLLDPPSLTLEPSTGLVDDQRVVATGERYVPDFFLSLLQCPAGFTDRRRECDRRGFGQIHNFGTLQGSLRIRAILDTEAGEVDCRSVDCVVIVVAEEAGVEVASAPIELDPDAPVKPPATLTITPSSGLADGQEVHLEGENFTPGGAGLIQQCPATAANTNGCAWRPHRFDYAGPGGRIDTTLEVAAVIEVNGQTVDCRQVACVVLAGDGFDEGYDSARAPISFADGAAATSASPVATEPRFTG